MNKFAYEDQNLCSISGIEPTFSGRSILRNLLTDLLRDSSMVAARIHRPSYTFPIRPEMLTGEVATELLNLHRDEDWFSLSFNYRTHANNDRFIELYLEIWFVYEQPSLSFLALGTPEYLYHQIQDEWKPSWKQITSTVPSYVLFKSIEEDVVWIGKSEALSFDFL